MFQPAKILAHGIITLVVLVSLCRCGPEREAAPAEESISYTSRGTIVASASRYVDVSTEEPFEQFEIIGLFPRYDVEKTDLVDSLLGTRVPQPDLPLDSCTQPTPILQVRPRRSLGAETEIELMDVGDLSVEFDVLKRAIPTRTFPDLLKVIDGVIYSANESREVEFDPGTAYTILASGTDAVQPFEVVLEAPDDLGVVTLDGIPVDEQMPVVHRGRDLEVLWEGEGYGDEVIATIDWTNVGLSWSMACRMRDDGHFVIPADITGMLLDPLVNNDHEMTLSRVRQVGFKSNGLASAEFSFVVSTSFLVRFESAR